MCIKLILEIKFMGVQKETECFKQPQTLAVLPELQSTRPTTEVEKLPLHKALDCETFPNVAAGAALASVCFLS